MNWQQQLRTMTAGKYASLLLMLVLSACNSDTTISGGDYGSGGWVGGKLAPGDKSKDDKKGGLGEASDETELFKDEENDGIPKLASDEGESDSGEIDYPELDFYGRGSLTYDGDTYPSWGEVSANMDSDTLVLNLTNMRIEVGRNQSKADEETNKELGESVYTRVPRNKMVRLIKDENFNNAPYVIFASKAVKPNNKGVFRFDPPLPVFAWPSRSAAYDDLRDNGSETWSATVNGQYEAHVTVSYEGESGGNIKIRITCDIPSDTNGAIYETFPISKEATFYIDPEARRVMRMDMTDLFYNEDDKRRERNDLTWKLCKADHRGEVQDFSCR